MLQDSTFSHNIIRLIQHRLRVQRQSEGIKKGEGPTHKQAVKNVIKFINEHNPKVITYEGWWVKYNHLFVRRENITWTPEHEYDIAINVNYKTYFIEIDGESHGKKDIRGHEQRKIKDNMAVKHAAECNIEVIRLDKTECLGKPKEREEYLGDKLGEYIK